MRKLDWVLNGSAFLLSFLGLVSIYSIKGGHGLFFEKQFLFILSGMMLVWVVSFLDYRVFSHPKIVFFMYTVSLLVLSAVLILGTEIRGSTSWFRFGPVSLEPVEFVKIALIILLAKYFSSRHIEIARPIHIIISGAYVFLPMGLVLLQPDLGSAFMLFAIWFGVMAVSGIRMRHVFVLGLCSLMVLTMGWHTILKDYQKSRLLSFINPAYDPYGAGYNVDQALIAIGAGGLTGEGIGQGTQTQLGFLPEPHTDFIFASIAEEFGFMGGGILFILFFVLLSRLIVISMRAQNNFSRFLCVGTALALLAQFFVNVGMNLGIFPVTGVPLPLVSYGGSGLFGTLLLLGIVQSVNVHASRQV